MAEQRGKGSSAKRQPKRAITLAGGGPTGGLSVGALKRFEEDPRLSFDVWSSASVGAWTMVAYHGADPGREIDQTVDFFRHVFRPDDEYERFPIATIFTPDWFAMAQNLIAFTTNPSNYRNLVVPDQIRDSLEAVYRFMTDPTQWAPGPFNYLMLNHVLAPNPVVRFWTSLIYQSPIKGLARVDYPNSPLLDKLNFDRLYEDGKPTLYHNSYNMDKQSAELFTNKYKELNQRLGRAYRPITPNSLVACSALPYIEQPVDLNGETFAEGAVINTVNFENLMADHPDLDEVWVSRILDQDQVKPPENLYDALNNLVMLFAATTSEDDVKIFKHKIKANDYNVKVVDLPVWSKTNFDWTYSNFDKSFNYSYQAADHVLKKYWNNESTDVDGILDAACDLPRVA